jgi:beta-aspartyl-peptidase (threonine type)
MKTCTIILSLTMLLCFVSIVPAQNDRSEAAIRRVMDEQTAAWNRGDIDAFMLGYWNSPQLVFVSGDNVTRGWQPTLERYKKNYDSRAKMGQLTFGDLQITVLSKNSAVVLGSWSLTREKDNPHGKFTLIFRKFKEGWRIVHDHTS